MSRFIEEDSRTQSTLFPERLEDFIADDNPIRVIEAFVEGLDLRKIGFNSAIPKQTGRPAYRPATLLKLYIYGYMNRIQSSRRLEQETHRNVELMWLLGRLQPDFKTIANFRKDNSRAIQQCCREFVEICRKLDLFAKSIIAIDGSKFKAVNTKQKHELSFSGDEVKVAHCASKCFVFSHSLSTKQACPIQLMKYFPDFSTKAAKPS